MNELSIQDAAYIAGIIDGEGCVLVGRTKTGPAAKGCRTGFAYRSCVSVTLTCRPLLTWLRVVTGVGKICRATSKQGHSLAWRWQVWSIEAASLLGAIRPFLRIKIRQADNLIEFQSIMRRPGRRGLSEEEWARRQYHYERSLELNRKECHKDGYHMHLS